MEICEYKGFNIRYEETCFGEGFSIKENSSIRRDKLSEIKKDIDKISKKDFKRFPLIYDQYNNYLEVEVTSISEDGDYWVNDSKGNRTKTHPRNLLKFTEENLNKIKAIENIKREQRLLSDKISQINKTFERLIKGEE